jgi:hypothetical protein
MITRRTFRALATVVAFVAGSSVAAAAPIFAGYPPPGGASFSSTPPLGSLIDSPGKTRIYSNFDSSQWDALYWQITDGFVGNADFVTTNAGSALPTLSGNQLTWRLSELLTAGSTSTAVQLVTKFYQADGLTPLLASDFVVGDPGMPLLLLQFTPAELAAWGGGFQVQQVYQTLSGQDVKDFYDPIPGSGFIASSTNAAFWYDQPTSVPEPTSLSLFGGGLLALAGSVYRRSARSRLSR